MIVDHTVRYNAASGALKPMLFSATVSPFTKLACGHVPLRGTAQHRGWRFLGLQLL